MLVGIQGGPERSLLVVRMNGPLKVGRLRGWGGRGRQLAAAGSPPVESRLSECYGGISAGGMSAQASHHVRDDGVLRRVRPGKVSGECEGGACTRRSGSEERLGGGVPRIVSPAECGYH